MSPDTALARLQQALGSPDTAQLAGALRDFESLQPASPLTWFARAELQRRGGDTAAALASSGAALSALLGPDNVAPGGELQLGRLIAFAMRLPAERLALATAYFDQFGGLCERAGVTHRLADRLGEVAAPLLDPANARHFGPAHALTLLLLLGFKSDADARWCERVFESLVVPWMVAAAGAGHFDTALFLEGWAYGEHTKRQESQEWFKATTGRWIAPLAERVRQSPLAARARPAWRPEPVRRVAIFLHNATLLAHVMVVIETLTAVAEVGARNYSFTVFAFGGRSPAMQEAFARCGVEVRYLDENPALGPFDRLLALRAAIAEGNFAVCLWVSLVTMMAVAYPLRVAPLQAWWAMKYHACDIAEIDAHLAVENVVLAKSMDGIEWRTSGTASKQWIDPARAGEARALRAKYPADAIVAAAIGREEKLDSPQFLAAIAELLQRHANLHFLWTGRVARESIRSVFDKAGVADRAPFIGWVDTKLHAMAIDLFLDSFPFPCGFTLKEAMAAGKPVVLYRCPESLETGVPGAITPVIECTASAPPEVRERLRAIFTRSRDFDLYHCAATPEAYVQTASRLIADPQLRAQSGAANAAFIREFLSSPADEARKFLDHLDAMFQQVPTS